MMINNLTQIPSNSPTVEYVFAFDAMLKNYAMFTILLAILIVFMVAIYYWRQDFVFAFKNSVYIVTFGSFVMTLIKSSIFLDGVNPARLLGFEKFTFFLILLVLAVFYEQVSEK